MMNTIAAPATVLDGELPPEERTLERLRDLRRVRQLEDLGHELREHRVIRGEPLLGARLQAVEVLDDGSRLGDERRHEPDDDDRDEEHQDRRDERDRDAARHAALLETLDQRRQRDRHQDREQEEHQRRDDAQQRPDDRERREHLEDGREGQVDPEFRLVLLLEVRVRLLAHGSSCGGAEQGAGQRFKSRELRV
jgi:hypothetical protein